MPTGMELIHAIRSEQADPPAGIRTLGLDGTHRWLTLLEPGRAHLRWPVDPAYANLEGATICSWTVAVADQALFFAATSLCEDGEHTRMSALSLSCASNIDHGTVTFEAEILERSAGAMHGRCGVVNQAGVELAAVEAKIEVFRT